MRNVLVARGMVRHTRCRNVGTTLALSFRAGNPSDAERLGHGVIEGFAGYRSFARPPRATRRAPTSPGTTSRDRTS